jgi:hypothetical protein
MVQDDQVLQDSMSNHTEDEATWESKDFLHLRHPDFELTA